MGQLFAPRPTVHVHTYPAPPLHQLSTAAQIDISYLFVFNQTMDNLSAEQELRMCRLWTGDKVNKVR